MNDTAVHKWHASPAAVAGTGERAFSNTTELCMICRILLTVAVIQVQNMNVYSAIQHSLKQAANYLDYQD